MNRTKLLLGNVRALLALTTLLIMTGPPYSGGAPSEGTPNQHTQEHSPVSEALNLTKAPVSQEEFSGGKVASGDLLPPSFRFEPVDLTTDVPADFPLQVWIENRALEIDPVVVSELASSVTLRTWPDLTVVPMKSEIRQPVKESDSYTRIFLRPESPLTEQWYAIYIDKEISGLTLADDPANSYRTGKAAMARFRVGSDPILVSIREYNKGDSQIVLYIDFSEPIAPESGIIADALRLQSATGTTLCRAQNLLPGRMAGSIKLTCRQALLEGNEEIVISKGIYSATGHMVREQSIPIDRTGVVNLAVGLRYMKLEDMRIPKLPGQGIVQ